MDEAKDNCNFLTWWKFVWLEKDAHNIDTICEISTTQSVYIFYTSPLGEAIYLYSS